MDICPSIINGPFRSQPGAGAEDDFHLFKCKRTSGRRRKAYHYRRYSRWMTGMAITICTQNLCAVDLLGVVCPLSDIPLL